ncbi:helix-turn-helix domain-containing protein [Enterococcus sp. 669A]|uniref:Helix-turn-helix domain-containing protein n=1 Tax=Candidatus Enterococcus moelleringii TaxID=2815325 RepID=A0ABS3L9M7_9ENTE|nr:helix-turn-helix domain-containing protein [Enterococcus sp. 669A]MBO1306322.1 helix-turn-helix domain-containing protein [Enterococcus sp. 669A]
MSKNSDESRKIELADRISRAREDAGLSIEDFAKELKLSVSNTVSLERGQMVLTDSLLKRISEVLNTKFE